MSEKTEEKKKADTKKAMPNFFGNINCLDFQCPFGLYPTTEQAATCPRFNYRGCAGRNLR